MLEEDGLAAADLAPMQHGNAAIFILGEDAGNGTTDALDGKVDLRGQRDFLAGHRRVGAEAVEVLCVL